MVNLFAIITSVSKDNPEFTGKRLKSFEQQNKVSMIAFLEILFLHGVPLALKNPLRLLLSKILALNNPKTVFQKIFEVQRNSSLKATKSKM